MVKLIILGVLIAISVACGSDVADSASNGASELEPEPELTLPDPASPLNSTEADVATPAPTQRAPSLSPELSSDHQSLTPCTSKSTYIFPSDDPSFSDVTNWPDTSGLLFDPRAVDPWDTVQVPAELPRFPEFEFSGGLRVPTDVAGDEPVTLGILAANGYERAVAFELSRDPGYDFAVFDSTGQEVWRYSEQVEVRQATSFLELEPRTEQLLEAEWNLTGKNGARVKDGIYWVYGIVFREEPYRWHVGTKPVYVGERPSLEEALQVKLLVPETVQCGDRVPMTITITNVSDSPVNIYTGVDFDNYHASVPGGEEFWNWWKGKARILPLYIRYIAPGKTALFRRSWSLDDGEGGRVTPGKYELKASIRAAQVDDIVNRTETAWSNIVEVTVVP